MNSLTVALFVCVAIASASAGWVGHGGATLVGPSASASVHGPDGSHISGHAPGGVVSAAVAPGAVVAGGHGLWGGWGGAWGHGWGAPAVVAGPAVIAGPAGTVVAGAAHGHGHWW